MKRYKVAAIIIIMHGIIEIGGFFQFCRFGWVLNKVHGFHLIRRKQLW